MANIGEKAISILAGNLNSGQCYLITAVTDIMDSKLYSNDEEDGNAKALLTIS